MMMLCLAGTAAGLLNAVAGCGIFLSLTALIYVGVPPVAANATATLSALSAYLSSARSFRGDMRTDGALGWGHPRRASAYRDARRDDSLDRAVAPLGNQAICGRAGVAEDVATAQCGAAIPGPTA